MTSTLAQPVLDAGRAALAVARVLITLAYTVAGGRPVEATVIALVVVPWIVAMTAYVSRHSDPHRWRLSLWALCTWGGIAASSFLLAAFSIGVMQP